MNVLDIVLAGLILLGLIRGLMRGVFVEIASLVALVVGIYGAIHFSDYAAAYLENHVSWEERYINITAFAITFIILVLAITMAGKALTKLADFAALGLINKILGAVFGAIKITLILSVVLIVFSKMNKNIPFVSQETLDSSILYKPVKSLIPSIFPHIIESEDKLAEEDQIV